MKNAKKNTKKKSEKCYEIDNDSSDENECDTYSLQESDENYHESFSEYECEDEERNLEPGDFCVAKVFGKKENSFRLYIAKVLEIEHEGYEVRFFKRHDQTMKFKETEEESYIREADIVRRLPKPVTGSSARFNQMICFAADLSDLTNIH